MAFSAVYLRQDRLCGGLGHRPGYRCPHCPFGRAYDLLGLHIHPLNDTRLAAEIHNTLILKRIVFAQRLSLGLA